MPTFSDWFPVAATGTVMALFGLVNKLRPMLAIVLISCAALGAEGKETWKKFAPKEAGFSILFPSEPATGTIPRHKPPILTAMIKRTTVDSLSYHLTWSLREKPFEASASAIIYIRAAEQGAVKALKGKLIRSKRITQGELEGREFMVEVSQDNMVRQRIFAGDRFVYSFSIWGKDESAVQSRDAEKFFQSFKLDKEAEDKESKK